MYDMYRAGLRNQYVVHTHSDIAICVAVPHIKRKAYLIYRASKVTAKRFRTYRLYSKAVDAHGTARHRGCPGAGTGRPGGGA